MMFKTYRLKFVGFARRENPKTYRLVDARSPEGGLVLILLHQQKLGGDKYFIAYNASQNTWRFLTRVPSGDIRPEFDADPIYRSPHTLYLPREYLSFEKDGDYYLMTNSPFTINQEAVAAVLRDGDWTDMEQWGREALRCTEQWQLENP